MDALQRLRAAAETVFGAGNFKLDLADEAITSDGMPGPSGVIWLRVGKVAAFVEVSTVERQDDEMLTLLLRNAAKRADVPAVTSRAT